MIVVAYGNEEHLSACLETLGCDVPVVVVDNGRSDLARHICSVFGADYLESAANLGFAAAVNLAIKERRSIGTDVLLLNPDARLDHSHLNILLHHLHRSHDIAAVGPRLRSPGGDTQKTLWPIPSPWLALATMVGVGDRLSRRRFVNGAVLLLRGAAVDAIGGFDERFFLYSEEADWQLRAIRAGWKVAAALDSNAIHVGGGTSSNPTRREILFNASAERFIRKWYGPLGWHIFRIASIITASRRLLISRNPKMKPTYRRAILQFWRGPVRYLASQQGSE